MKVLTMPLEGIYVKSVGYYRMNKLPFREVTSAERYCKEELF